MIDNKSTPTVLITLEVYLFSNILDPIQVDELQIHVPAKVSLATLKRKAKKWAGMDIETRRRGVWYAVPHGFQFVPTYHPCALVIHVPSPLREKFHSEVQISKLAKKSLHDEE